jgi:hypothetical protein
MELIAVGLEVIGKAIIAFVMWPCLVQMFGIAASTFLIYTDKITKDDVKHFIIIKPGNSRR